MQSYIAHSDYFEELTRKVKLFSHGRLDANTGEIRMCFFRMNQVEEALAGQVEGMHFPALIHNDYAAKGSESNGNERLNVVNNFWVLVKPDEKTADGIAAAYSLAELAIQKLISFMLNEWDENGTCGPFRSIDLSMCSWSAIEGAEMDGLYGFEFTMRAQQKAILYTTYNEDDYYP